VTNNTIYWRYCKKKQSVAGQKDRLLQSLGIQNGVMTGQARQWQ